MAKEIKRGLCRRCEKHAAVPGQSWCRPCRRRYDRARRDRFRWNGPAGYLLAIRDRFRAVVELDPPAGCDESMLLADVDLLFDAILQRLQGENIGGRIPRLVIVDDAVRSRAEQVATEGP